MIQTSGRTILIIFNLFLLTSYVSCEALQNRKELKKSEVSVLAARDAVFLRPIPREEGPKAQLNADHYLFSNERRIEMFEPYIKDLRGGYIGVGTDQNLTLAAWAKSEYIWLMDFDDWVVRINKIHIAALKKCPDYQCFRDFWQPENQKTSWAYIEETFKNEPDFAQFKAPYQHGIRKNWGIPERLRDLDFMTKKFGFNSFHNRAEDYQYLHEMAKAGRIRADRGDLTKTGTMQRIAAAAKEMNIPIRIVYTSNAEEYFRYPREFRDNILSLPTDEYGYLVRTMTTGAKTFGFPEGEKFPNDFPFHYNIQKLENMKEWMKFNRYLSIILIMKGHKVIQKGFSVQETLPADNGYTETGDITRKGPGER